ncbi:MAG TPA: SDR family oxidoreductase [Bryobacteraceae bacterium]|jgi:gluconate 5-dehydrogenase|nr:SDR family oxidoreductase [Bryobacteraceae bacterium]
MFELNGRTALVVGASRGIGLAIARGIAEAGARTIVAGRSIQKLRAEAARIGGEALELDVSSFSPGASLPETDILINVAGTNIRKRFEQYTAAEYEHIMRTNLHGLAAVTQRAGADMIARGRGGKIVFIGSLTSVVGLPWISVYAMTKSALAGLTRSLASEWGRYGIQVNCIAPGFILTDLNRAMWQPPQMQQWLEGAQSIPRLGRPEDIAPLAVFLSGAGADYITGQVIAVDGGYSTTANWPFSP